MDTLPKSYIDSNKVESEIRSLEEQIEGLNRHLDMMRKEGIPVTLDFIKQSYEEQSFHKWMERAQASYIGQIGFIPNAERRRIKDTFSQLESKISTSRETVYDIVSKAKYDLIEQQDGVITYDFPNVRKRLNKKYSYTFTDSDIAYFKLLSALQEAYNRIVTFEQENGYLAISRTFKAQDIVQWFSVDWFTKHLNKSIGKLSDKARRMLEEQEADENEE